MAWSARRTALGGALGAVAGLDVVDLGCGDGSFARRLLERGASSVLALDLDPERLDVARAVAPDDRLHLEQADLDQATLPFEAYDLACCPVLHLLDDPVRLGRMARSGLRQHARLVCAVPASQGDRCAAALVEAGLRPVGDDRGQVRVIVVAKPARGRP